MVWWAKGLIALEWAYGLAVLFPKLAILSFYLFIFHTKPYRRTVYALGVICIGSFLAIGLTAVLQCFPLAYVWDKTIEGGHCIDQLAFYRWISFPNIFTDLCMLVLPLPLVWSLNMSRAQKAGLTVVFLTGSL
jgi:hypothetical protein